jgi:type I restriction enzyme S subunit
MITDLKPYAEYKESGLPWLGQVPRHWEVRRLKGVVDPSRPITYGIVQCGDHVPGGVPYIRPVDMKEDGRVRIPHLKRTSSEIASSYRRSEVREGDVIVSIGPSFGKVMVIPAELSGANLTQGTARIAPSPVVDRFFAFWLIRSIAIHDAMAAVATGSTFLALNLNPLGRIKIPLPPPAEQAAIVRFLDWANGRLERAIRAKRKVIALLNEQKQAIIHRAVTRGLDPSVPLKDSGVPWLGEIPEHWRVVRNMALFAHRVEPGWQGLPVLQVSLRSGITEEELDQFGRPKRLIADHTKYKRINAGDIAYNTMRMWQGALGVSPTEGLVSPAYVVLRPRADTCSDFYDFLFHTEVYKQEVNRQSTGIVSDRNRLYWDSFKQMPNISLPPSEQGAIVVFIRAETGGLDTAISRLEREITLLREYRTRLVADVVTGKLDVRAAAAALPDEAPLGTTEEDAAPDDDAEATDEEVSA